MNFLLRGLDSQTLIDRYNFIQKKLQESEIPPAHRDTLQDMRQDILEILNRRGVRITL